MIKHNNLTHIILNFSKICKPQNFKPSTVMENINNFKIVITYQTIHENTHQCLIVG